jgi:hypothetical protein
MTNWAAGVHPRQVKRAQARLKALGAPGIYNRETGDLVVDSPKDYSDFCRLTGRTNLGAGYSDWAGTGGRAPIEEMRARLKFAGLKTA